ncbi:MAG TPA: hypothetical protein VIR82_18830, partial [Bradyrhizobium sp.]
LPRKSAGRAEEAFSGGEWYVRPHPEEPRSGVSKDEWHEPGHMVRDGAKAPPHHEGLAIYFHDSDWIIDAKHD